jgi:outer membrane lipoprotein SlyB
MIVLSRVFACAGMLGVLLLAACAAPPPPPPPVAAAPIVGVSYGEIVSVRTVAIPAGAAALPANLLGALGASQATAGASAARMEFIVKLDNTPQPVSIVQVNPDNLRPGERVALTYGDRVRIARAGT